MKVLLTVASSKAAYGGPAVSVVALGAALSRAGVQTGLWCPDGSALHIDLARGGHRLHLLGGSLEEAITSFGRPHVMHDNGIWWPHNHRIAQIAAKDAVPRIVSVRGMLEPWARRHKRLKKTIGWWAYQRNDLRSAAMLHVTSAQEKASVQALMPGVPIFNLPNGLELPGSDEMAFGTGASADSRRQALFMGRLHPIKGLDVLLHAWSLATPRDWKLVLAGPDENGYRAHLEGEIGRLGLHGAVEFAGPVTGIAKSRLFQTSELFILPSHSESFGIAVGEALAHGLPVVTTKNVPWPQLQVVGCGWRVNGAAGALAKALTDATACSSETLAHMGKRGHLLIADEYGWGKVADQFIEHYEILMRRLQKGLLA